ncbi:aftiphilin a isoform X2 [Festucalex cinctus]
MEPDVIRLYSSSPPPLEDGEEEEDEDEFGDFGAFSTVSASVSFGESFPPDATSPPELPNGIAAKANGAAAVAPGRDRSDVKRPDARDGGSEVITNGFAAADDVTQTFAGDASEGADGLGAEFADFDDGTGADVEATPLPVSCDTQADAQAGDGDFAQDAAAAAQDGVNGGVDDDVDDVINGVDGRTSSTETETSLGRPLSTDALDEYGEASTTGSAPSPPPLPEESATPADHSRLDDDDDEEFGDFGNAGLPGDQSFADFNHQEASPPPQARDDEEGGASSSAHCSPAQAGWNAFGEEEAAAAADEWTTGESWAEFSSEDDSAPPAGHAPVEVNSKLVDDSRHTEALWSRVEKLLEASFPRAAAPSPSPAADEEEERVPSLKTLMEDVSSSLGGGVWSQLRDVHEAVGLRHQWGGSYCNKTLLACLGIDTRNILFTGQKKQPLIVPVYAASLGMLEPTKEPAKPVSAAEMIASIAQAPAAPDGNSCSADVVQEALPPVQFDWSSSGLTNPLDGVDPELVELTTAKMDSGGAGGRVVDAFARLMSTMDKTSTSTRKTRKEEKLSSEAAQVICGLPDLSFMTAKVLMFPATLMPLASQATPD